MPSGQVQNVDSGGPTSTTCLYPDGSKAAYANAGEGGPITLNNSSNLTFQNYSMFGDDPTPRDTPYAAALYMFASPFHVATRTIAGQGLVWNGFEFVVGTVHYDESYWSTEIVDTYLADYYSQNLNLTNTGDITIEAGAGDPFSPIEVWGSVNAVSVTNSGDLTAAGDFVNGIRAVSGLGQDPFRWNVNPDIAWPGGAVTVTNSGKINIDGFAANGIRADALGGGITIVNSGDITMAGESNTAILADQWSTNNEEFADDENQTISIKNSGQLSLDGNNSRGISAEMRSNGTIGIENSSTISVTGEDAIGIAAHIGEDAPDGTADSLNIRGNGAVAVNGIAAAGFDVHNQFGSTDIEYDGAITASGDHAVGVIASTISGSTNVTVNGNVSATGAGGKGVMLLGLSDPAGGSDVLTSSGTLTAEVGSGVTVAGGSTANVDFPIERIGTGVLFLGGTANTLRNHGTIAAASGTAVWAYDGPIIVSETDEDTEEETQYTFQIRSGPLKLENFGLITGDIIAGSGNDSIENSGTISGDVDLGAGTNSIGNTGRFNSDTDIKVGGGNTFTNRGTFSAGGDAAIKKTVLVGNFVQTSDGLMIVNVNPNSLTSDLLEVTGRATLAGSVAPIISLSSVVESQYTILTAAGGIQSGSALSVADTAAYDFEIILNAGSDSNGVVTLTAKQVVSTEELVAAGMSAVTGKNAANLGGVAKAIVASSTGTTNAMTPIVNAIQLGSGDPQQLAQGLATLLPQSPGAQTNNTSGGNIAFGNTMLSCTERDGVNRWTREGQCYYAKFGARRLERDAIDGGSGVDETSYELMGGAQVALRDQLRFGFALGYEDLSTQSFNTVQRLGASDGDRVTLGLVLKNQWGPWNAYLNLVGSYANYDHSRYINLGMLQETAVGDQDIWSGASRLRVSHTTDFGPWYWKPMIDFAATYIHADGYSETGAAAALKLSDSKNWLFSIAPALEVGTEIVSADGVMLRPYLRGGVIVFDDDEVSVTTNFVGAPAGIAPFVVTGEYEQVAADVEAGLHVLTPGGVNMKLNYEGRYGEDSQQHAGGIKVSAPY